MESRWYLFAGQTLENTKISDRVNALHITDSAWKGITKHLDRKKMLQEALDKEKAVKQYLDEGSKNMTEKWENSLENVRKRKEEERLKMIEQKKDDRMQKFMALRKEQEAIRKQYRDKVHKQIFMSTGYARALTSALVTSDVLYEREKQIELQNKIKQHELDENKKYVDIMKKEVEAEAIKKIEEQEKEAEKQRIYGSNLRDSIKEKLEVERALKETTVREEAEDNIEAMKELEKLDKIMEQDKLKKKRALLTENQKILKEVEEGKRQHEREEKELDEVVKVYQVAKHRIDCMRKQREKELRDSEVERRQKIAALVMAERENREAVENEILQKAIAEKDAIELQKIKDKLEFQEKMKRERLENRQEVLQREAEKRRKDLEIQKWETLNRYKAQEYHKIYEEKRKRELWAEIIRYRQTLLEQIEDNKLCQQTEKELDEMFITTKTNLEDDNTKFFEYAKEVMEMAQKKNRSIVPINRVIEEYMKAMSITVNPLDESNQKQSGDLSNNTKLKNTKKITKTAKKKICGCSSK
ncbi:calponin homology domain-containing protein DDB_G0272472-like [Sitophilus oryzae]|uniref:Calponin homology domain-containing protein DDB_G0272472-like n=1 Tax=Sitophilus oryzae TaxID=7048 RepID=A0A6J2YBR1_SITOR|nr:calponin homology domain-containing protein DDB_G0272472-like [Sitophilus oryzae]